MRAPPDNPFAFVVAQQCAFFQTTPLRVKTPLLTLAPYHTIADDERREALTMDIVTTVNARCRKPLISAQATKSGDNSESTIAG
jgi:hypothetical protein